MEINNLRLLRFVVIVALHITLSKTGNAQAPESFTLSGYVRESGSAETMIGVNIFLRDKPQVGTASNLYGFYSLTLPKGRYSIVFSYVGYSPVVMDVMLERNTVKDISLSAGIEMQEDRKSVV